jgi:GT2 family glycosyltransferase
MTTARAVNRGLRSATRDTTLVTHDDCTVAREWAAHAYRLWCAEPSTLFTGRVLPSGDSRAVPSTIDDPRPHDFTGKRLCGVLYPNNMVCDRREVFALGGFDERIPHAEDNDLCYRWLCSGRSLKYEPELVVWHRDWRTHAELEDLYIRYWSGQGAFYAKHLRQGDRAIWPLISRDLLTATRASVGAVVRRRPRWSDPRRGVLRGLVPGLARGWWTFRDEERDDT